jgi:hypothetical protein
MKLVSKTTNGQIAYCQCAHIFHLEFGNILLNLNSEDLRKLYKYIQSVDMEYYLNHNKHSFNRRKLVLQIGAKNIFLCLSSTEFLEFKNLLTLKKQPRIINNSEVIDFELQLN